MQIGDLVVETGVGMHIRGMDFYMKSVLIICSLGKFRTIKLAEAFVN